MDLATLEPWIRSGVFVAVFLLLAWAQRLAPRRANRHVRDMRANAALFATNTLVTRLLATYSLLGVSIFAGARHIGLFNSTNASPWLEAVTAVVLLDLGVYWQHRLFHWIPLFWRLHAVHHTDVAFDLTTGVRFHPGEILISLVFKAMLVVLLGAAPIAVLVFEALLSSASLFTHSNVALPARFDRVLRTLVVTPDMHRIHHSVIAREHNSNFGFLASWWDRLFGSFRSMPDAGHTSMNIGLVAFRDPQDQTFSALLQQPFKPESSGAGARQ